MRIVYPASILNSKKVDEFFEDEADILKFSFIVLNLKSKNRGSERDKLFYRGWMLSYQEYLELINFADENNLELITSIENYYNAHYIQNWYEKVEGLTPKTWFFKDIEDLKLNIDKTGLSKFFIKDSVKSLTTKKGSIANNKEELFQIIEELSTLKGIEGIIAIREVHNFINDSEIRYFSMNGNVYHPEFKEVSDFVINIAEKFKNIPFISIDIIKDNEGREWLVEIGDGQVSDLKMWNAEDFAEAFHNEKNGF